MPPSRQRLMVRSTVFGRVPAHDASSALVRTIASTVPRDRSNVLRLLQDGRVAVRTISHRELRNNSAEVLRAVGAGETIEVTNHGEVAAGVSPPPLSPTEPSSP